MCVTHTGQAQDQRVSRQIDTRSVALEVYQGLSRKAAPETIAVRLQRLIQAYRYACLRVSDYQLYENRSNLLVLKVKCSGAPLYGVTVASNGYRAVQGGNGLIKSFDPRDGDILTFSAKGDRVADRVLRPDELLHKTRERVEQEDPFALEYLGFMLGIIGVFAVVAGLLWVRRMRHLLKGQRRSRARGSDRRRSNRRRSSDVSKSDYREGHDGSTLRTDVTPQTGPLSQEQISLAKNLIQDESAIINRHIYRHPNGIYLARGARGKRRFFKNRLGAELYKRFNIKWFEISFLEFAGLDRLG